MKVLFVSVWPFESGILQSTIPATISYWIEHKIADQVDLVTFEESQTTSNWNSQHSRLIQIQKKRSSFYNFFFQLYSLIKLIRKEKYDIIWSRGVTAGNLIYFSSIITGVKFGMESFEPHADYMIEGTTWKKKSVKSWFQHFIERRQAKGAEVLVAVSEAYAKLIPTKHDRKKGNVYSMPCAVDFEIFKFNDDIRNRMRTELNFNNEDVVGIYAGKFGDIYYDDYFFRFVKSSIAHHKNLKFLILTPMIEHAEKQKSRFEIKDESLTILSVPHHLVTNYLSASDFGICPVKESPSRRFCSPIKTGEYYANGLPILISRGIGDDSEFIREKWNGTLFDFTNPNGLKDIEWVKRVEDLTAAIQFRSKGFLFKEYSRFFNDKNMDV